MFHPCLLAAPLCSGPSYSADVPDNQLMVANSSVYRVVIVAIFLPFSAMFLYTPTFIAAIWGIVRRDGTAPVP